jgi:hypothetical protein
MAEPSLGYSYGGDSTLMAILPPMNTQRLFLEKDAEHVTTTFRNRRSGGIHPRSRSHLGTRHRYQVARRANATLASDNDLVDRWSRVPPGRGCRRIPPSLHLIARGSAARYGIILEVDRTPVGSTPLLVPLVPTERPRSRNAQVLDLGRGTEGSNPVPSSGESDANLTSSIRCEDESRHRPTMLLACLYVPCSAEERGPG